MSSYQVCQEIAQLLEDYPNNDDIPPWVIKSIRQKVEGYLPLRVEEKEDEDYMYQNQQELLGSYSPTPSPRSSSDGLRIRLKRSFSDANGKEVLQIVK